MFSVRCPIRVEVADGIVKWIEGNPHDPGMAGRLCAKGSAGIAMEYDYERSQYPMIRKGKRGEGEWERATWEEALDFIAEKLKAIIVIGETVLEYDKDSEGGQTVTEIWLSVRNGLGV